MTLRTRIKRLEGVARRRAPAQRAPNQYDDEDWLAVFEA
jgi:hypothetical protein